MNTTMADGAAQRLVAQIGEDLFGQPGLNLMELAERIKGLRASQSEPISVPNRLTDRAVDENVQRDAARWRAIAPHLQVEWDQDEIFKRWSWIDFKDVSLSVRTPTRKAYADANEAMDALIVSQQVRNA